jgi:hypothetical protein
VTFKVSLTDHDCPNTQVAFDAQFAKPLFIVADPSGDQFYVTGPFAFFLCIHIASSLATD